MRVVLVLLSLLLGSSVVTATLVDLRGVQVVTESKVGATTAAAAILAERVAALSRVDVAVVASEMANTSAPWIVLEGGVAPAPAGCADARSTFEVRFRVSSEHPPRVHVQGNALYGVGFLLREVLNASYSESYTHGLETRLSMRSEWPCDGWEVVRCASTWMRSQMISYRSISNSYDGWTPQMMQAYIEDMGLWGANMIEMVAPDGHPSPHFVMSPLEMSGVISGICHALGLNTSIWAPLSDPPASDAHWEALFSGLVRLDSLFVPGGDPSSYPPDELLAHVAHVGSIARKFHPGCGVWVSNQGFNGTQMTEFWDALALRPTWLTGVVYGPHTRITMQDTIAMASGYGFLVRHYPDISHGLKAEFPFPNWDFSFGFTEARETVCPRPNAETAIFREYQTLRGVIGFGTYSDGVKDDLNKCLWNALAWNASTDPWAVVGQYARLYIGQWDPTWEEMFVQAIQGLEANWVAGSGADVALPLSLLSSLWKANQGQLLGSWRMQMHLYRANYDALQAARKAAAQDEERRVMDILAMAGTTDTAALAAANDALAVLALDAASRVGTAQRQALFELAAMLFESVTMQLSVPLYGAANIGRGASLDTVDVPLNSRLWLAQSLDAIVAAGEAGAAARVEAIVTRTDPGPGGFYDDLGTLGAQPHLVPGQGAATDPMFFHTALVGMQSPFNVSTVPVYPLEWYTIAQSMYDAPLEVAYTGLVPGKAYRVGVVYAGDKMGVPVRMEANGRQIHGYLSKPNPLKRLWFTIPAGTVTEDGALVLSWNQPPGGGGDGRGCQVAEVLLSPSPPPETRN